jgi:hypothetical protein
MFDMTAFQAAFESKDAGTWLAFYAPDAEWVEYRHNAPPSNPNRMQGHGEIGAFLTRVCGSPIGLSLSDVVTGPDRAAFRVTCTFPNGKQIIENVIISHSGGKITRQTDVEAWD